MSAFTLLERLSAVSPFLLPVVLDAAVKGLVILALTAMAALAMRRAAAAARHLVWFLGTLSLLILPILSAALPGWHILPQWALSNSAPVPAALPTQQVYAPVVTVPPMESFPHPVAEAPPPISTEAPLPPLPATPSVRAPVPQAPASPPLHLPWQAWAILVWLAGSTVFLGRVVLGCLSLVWLQHQSSRITEGSWPNLLRQLCTQFGLCRPVVLLSSPRRTMPMTWGLWRAHVLLPEDSVNWTADQRRTVLLHELAHAKRCDCLTQFAVQIVCALYWFNPLVWLGWHQMQIQRERACDDLVLSTGTKASAYAEQLLHIAAEMPAVRFSAAAIAMARPSTLESRLQAILDPNATAAG